MNLYNVRLKIATEDWDEKKLKKWLFHHLAPKGTPGEDIVISLAELKQIPLDDDDDGLARAEAYNDARMSGWSDDEARFPRRRSRRVRRAYGFPEDRTRGGRMDTEWIETSDVAVVSLVKGEEYLVIDVADTYQRPDQVRVCKLTWNRDTSPWQLLFDGEFVFTDSFYGLRECLELADEAPRGVALFPH